MNRTVIFDPLLPSPILIFLTALVFGFALLALVRGLNGWAMRGSAGIIIILALSGPKFQQEERLPLADVVILAKDVSASQHLADRPKQTTDAITSLISTLSDQKNIELRQITVSDGSEDSGTRLMTAITNTLAETPRSRIAGIIAVSDGQVHDADLPVNMPAPMHVLLTGHETDWDRRFIVKNAPAFAIIGEPINLTLRIEDSGAAPQKTNLAPLEISVDGAPAQRFNIRIGEDIILPILLPHSGRNVIQFTVPEAEGELTAKNNTALIQINGIRDRLRVLLVSGEPHAGSRTWRNLLKSDSSVDLVHFTILRPPGKQDGVPVDELSLIAFPTRELFLEKIDDFDLIIFDRYKRRGILPALYLDNVARYVRDGGAVLIAAGPDFASADSLYRSPLGSIMPAQPSGRVIDEPYSPVVSDIGERHPVTTKLPNSGDWGRWLRQVDVTPRSGVVVLKGIDKRPLLILDRVENGRVALLASDHAWLWNRGYEGGGPQLELLRRLAHWMMKEPELEEEALTATATGQTMKIIRRTLSAETAPVTITNPDGTTTKLDMEANEPGLFTADFDGPEIGLYHLENNKKTTIIGLGPAAPREFESTIASTSIMASQVATNQGGILKLEDGTPSIRKVAEGRPAAGRGWIGITPRKAYQTLDVHQIALLPPWLVLLLAASFITAAWVREGRR